MTVFIHKLNIRNFILFDVAEGAISFNQQPKRYYYLVCYNCLIIIPNLVYYKMCT